MNAALNLFMWIGFGVFALAILFVIAAAWQITKGAQEMADDAEAQRQARNQEQDGPL